MSFTKPLRFHNFSWIARSESVQFFEELYEESGPGGKFFINIPRRLTQSRFVSRNGEWTLPWEQVLVPGFEMPAYDPTFSKTFEEVTDSRALEIRELISQGKKIALMYSGGIDSTVILCSLLKNLTKEELGSLTICTSIHSVHENPDFWKKHVVDKIKVLDTTLLWYDNIIKLGFVPVTGDEGDAILGTQIGLNLYHNYDSYVRYLPQQARKRLSKMKHKISDPTVHFSNFKDIISRHLGYDDSPEGLEFGKQLYAKYEHNIATAKNAPPIESLHDFFWWLIFDVKYLNCSIRGSIYYNITMPVKDVIDTQFNWYNGREYQLWSMANNNNGQKIRRTVSSYKYAARKYIYDFDNNDWYFYFKTKLESLNNLAIKPKPRDYYGHHIIGIDNDYNHMVVTDPEVRDFFRESILNYKIDWY